MISSPRRNSKNFMKIQNEIENDLGVLLIVPKRLTSPDPFIVKAKASLTKGIKHYQSDGFVSSDVYEPDIRSTPKRANRALRIMDTLSKCFLARGYRIEHELSFSRVYLRKVYMQFKVREVRKQVAKNVNGNPKYEPTGALEFSLDNYRSCRWRDGRVKLEDQVLKILTTMEFEVNELNQVWEANSRKKKQLHHLLIVAIIEVKLNIPNVLSYFSIFI